MTTKRYAENGGHGHLSGHLAHATCGELHTRGLFQRVLRHVDAVP